MNEITKTIEQLVKSHDRLGLFISGGFDSTTLFYLLCKTMQTVNPSIELLIFTVPRYDDSVIHANRVFEWIKSEFPELRLSSEHVGNPDLHHTKQVTNGINQVTYQHKRLQLIVGDTKNPDEYLGQPGPERPSSDSSLVMQPFLEYDKTTVLQLALDMGVLDKISEISHTCTESKTLRCNMCWQCKERAWAFKKLELTDVGTM